MINVRTQLFDYLYRNLKDLYESITIANSFDPETDKDYPVITLTELDNNIHEPTQDTASNENYSRVSYEINIYYKSVSSSISQSNELSITIDNLMAKLGFIRKSSTYIPNYINTVNRQVMRYTAIINNKTYTTYRS